MNIKIAVALLLAAAGMAFAGMTDTVSLPTQVYAALSFTAAVFLGRWTAEE